MYSNKYFKQKEFECKCGKCKGKEMPDELLDVLINVREHFNSPTVITSGYRCRKYNARVGGARRSQHKEGKAADIMVKGVPAKDVHKFLIFAYPKKYGIGEYDMFTHIDIRPWKARW